MRLLPEISLQVECHLAPGASRGTHGAPQSRCYFNMRLSSIPNGLCIVILVRPKAHKEDWLSHSFQGLYGLSCMSDVDL